MIHRGTLAVATATMTMTAMLWPPVAQARTTCQDTATTTICQTSGSVSIAARPGTTAPPANRPSLPWWVWD